MNSNPKEKQHGSNSCKNALTGRLDAIRAANGEAGLRSHLASTWPTLRYPALKSIAIVGSADEGVRLAKLCEGLDIAVLAMADDNPRKQGTRVGNLKVGSTEEALGSLPRDVPVIVASHRALKPVRRVRGMGFSTVAPFMVLQTIDPVRFPPHMFHDGLLAALATGEHRLRELADRLADDQSRAVLAAVIGYRMDGDPEILDPIIEWDLYGPGALLHYGDDEVYVDGGTFDGDTIRLFIDRVQGRFSRVLGFEPDPGTFGRLKNNFASEPRVEPINAGLHRDHGTLRFHDAGTRGSVLVSTGGVTVPVVPLDGVLKGDRVTYIKMNIEGAELEALEGAAKSIKRWAPKLAISAYHRPDDLWRVPEKIHELRGDYSLYFRQHDGGIIETVAYGLPGHAN